MYMNTRAHYSFHITASIAMASLHPPKFLYTYTYIIVELNSLLKDAITSHMNLIEETSHVNLPQITPNEGTHLKVPRSIIEDLSVHFSLSEERTGHLRTTGRGREVRDISLVPVIFLIGGRVTDTVCVCV